MKNSTILCALLYFIGLCSLLAQSEVIVEVDGDIPVAFTNFGDDGLRLNHVKSYGDLDLSKPESMAQSYFYASDSLWDRKTYFDANDFPPFKNASDYSTISEQDSTNNYIKIRHKLCFEIEGVSWCKMLVTMHMENAPGPIIPQLLNVQKRNNKWYIGNIPNQSKLDLLTLNMKSCILGSLIKGEKTENVALNNLMDKSVVNGSYLNILELYDLRSKFSESEEKSFTNNYGNQCPDNLAYERLVRGHIQNLEKKKMGYIEVITEKRASFIDEVALKREKLIDSLSKVSPKYQGIDPQTIFSFKYAQRNFEILKYKPSTSNEKAYIWLSHEPDFGSDGESAIKKLVDIFKNSDAELFYIITSRLRVGDEQIKTVYDETRGDSSWMNLNRAYELFQSSPETFKRAP